MLRLLIALILLICGGGAYADMADGPPRSTSTAVGSWTPRDASGANLTLTITDAKFYRTGKLVTIIFNITYPANGSVGTAAIAGLPSAPYSGITGGDQTCAVIFPGSTDVVIAVFSNVNSTFKFWDIFSKAFLLNNALTTLNVVASCTYVSN